MTIDQELITTFYLCHRKAYLLKDKLSRAEGDIIFETDYDGVHLVAKANEISQRDGKEFAILNRPSKSVRERHIIEASFLLFIITLSEKDTGVLVRIFNGEKKINPRPQIITSMIKNIKQTLESDRAPAPTFSYACKDCPFYKECLSITNNSEDLSLINGIGMKRKLTLERAGFKDIEALSDADPKIISAYTGISMKEAEKITKQAKAISKSECIIIEKPMIPKTSTGYFFDVEKSDSDLYLLGIIRDGVYHHFLLDEELWETQWEEFLNFVLENPDEPIYHYDRFDRDVVRKFASLSKMDSKLLMKRFIDLYETVTRCLALPVRFYSLKDVAGIFGFKWRSKDFKGYEAMIALSEWKKSRDPSIMDQLLTYNEDDCKALQVLKDGILSL